MLAPMHGDASGLQLLADSTGIKMPGEGECKAKQHGVDYRPQWRDVHPGIEDNPRSVSGYDSTLPDGYQIP